MPTVASVAARAFAGLSLLAALAAYGELLVRLRRFESSAPGGPPWWFGYARDAVNLFGVTTMVASFRIAGYPGPQALLVGATLAFAAYTLDIVCGRWLALRHGRALVLFAGAALAAAALLA